jgi:predicted Zn-dependent protease
MNSVTRKTLIIFLVMAVVAVGGWAGRKAYQRATLNRLLADTSRYLAQRDIKQASLCLEEALTLNSANVRVNQLMADMLEEIASPAALGWRIRAAQLQTNDVTYRYEWARTALKDNDLASAGQALAGIDEKNRSSAEFHKLRGTLAWSLHLPAEAETEFSEALRLEPTNQVSAMNLETIRLTSTNAAVAGAARLALEKTPADSPLHLMAIRYLTADALSRKSFDKAIFFSRQVVADTNATYSDKLTQLQILKAANDGGLEAWLSGLKEDGTRSSDHAYLLAHWIQNQQSPAAALQWLRSLPFQTKTNTSVQLAFTDCQIAIKDWKGLFALVQKQDWDEFNYYRIALEALASRNLGDDMSEQSAWRRVMAMSSTHLDRLTKLDQLTAAWGWSNERAAVLQGIVSSFPKESWAGEELVALYYQQGDTHAMAALLNKLYAANPSNVRLENNLATVLMLLKSDPDKANRLAWQSYSSSTNNPFFACTYAYSLLLQSKTAEAVRVLGQINADTLKNPSIAAYYGVVEAQAGYKNAAKDALQVASKARLLPEEMELVKNAESRL